MTKQSKVKRQEKQVKKEARIERSKSNKEVMSGKS